MERVYNFSPGPSMLAQPVLEKAQKDLMVYGNTGMSVMEMSHRSKSIPISSTRRSRICAHYAHRG